MKVYFDLSKKALKSVDLENQTIYTGDIVSTLEVISNQVATTQYVLLSAKLPNGREVGPYTFDDLRVDDVTNNTSTWTFTLSRQNGFTLVAGNTTFYIWLVNGTDKKCIGAVNVNVEKAVSSGDSSYFISVDNSSVDETLTNMAAQIDQVINGLSITNTNVSTLNTAKVDKQTANSKGKITNTNSATEIERTENNYKSAISFLGDVLKSIVKNPSDASAPNTEIKQEDDQIEIKVVDSNYNNTFTLYLDATSFYVFDNRYSELYPVFQVSDANIYYKREKLLTSVNTANIVDRAVTGIKLALNSVGTTHIVDGAITNDKLANNAVDTANVKDEAITRAKLSQELQDFLNDIVASIPDGSVTTQKIVNGAVTKEKLATALATQIDGAGRKLALEIDTDFKIVAKLYDKDDNLISTSNPIDLPLESVVVSGSYDASTKKVVLTLQDGSTIEFSVADLVSGLQPEITSSNKLAVNLVAFSQVQLDALNSGITSTKVGNYDSHLSNTSNPHSVTKAQVGLGNVDNTSDANKPVSTAQQAALNFKEDKANKVTSISSASTNDEYPGAKATYDAIQNYGGAVGVNKALYHLGAYDTVSGNVITRKTGYVDEFTRVMYSWERRVCVNNSSVYYYNITLYGDWKTVSASTLNTNFINNLGLTVAKRIDVASNGTAPDNSIGIAGYDGGACDLSIRCDTYTTLESFIQNVGSKLRIQYWANTEYTENIIENQSILPLDTNMANKIRQKVVDGLQLWDEEYTFNESSSILAIINKNICYTLKPNTQYYFKAPRDGQFYFYDKAGNTLATEVSITANSYFTTPANCYGFGFYIIRYGLTYNHDIMISEKPYPYSPYNQKEHITNEQAELLKSEYDKTINLLSANSFTSTEVNCYGYVEGGTAQGSGGGIKPIYCSLKPGSGYTIRARLKEGDNTQAGLFAHYTDGTASVIIYFPVTSSYAYYTHTLYPNKEVDYLFFGVYRYDDYIKMDTTDIMIVKGTTVPSYQYPYGKIIHEADRPKLYRHFVKLYFGDSDYGFTGEVVCDNPNALTFDDLKALYPTETKQLKLYPSDPTVDDAIANTPSTGGADGAMIVSAYFNLYTENKVFACVVYVSNGKLVGEERVFYPSTQHGVDVRVAITDNVEDM